MSPRAALRSLSRRLGLEPDEGRRLVLMGTLVGLLGAAYTIAKVLRDTLFLSQFGALSLPYAYVAVALASAGLVWIESRWASRLAGGGATRLHQYVAVACSVAAALVYPYAHRWTTALFYVWTGSQAMMLLPRFWMLALELWDSRRARHVFPILGGCGLLGGLAGGVFAGWTTALVQRIGLLWTLPMFLLAATEITRRLEPSRARRPSSQELAGSPWTIVRRSPYIMTLVGVLALSVIVGTLVDFQFKLLIQQRYPDPRAMSQFFGRFYAGLNALSLLFQFGIAGWLIQRLGLGFATGIQPAAVLALASWLVAAPGMGVVVAMRWFQGVLSQTLGKSSNEIYYTAIRPSSRRRIKPAIDTLVERWSDALVGVLLVVTLHAFRVPVIAIAVLTIVLTTIWLTLLFSLDRQFGRAFEQILSSRWIEPDETPEALRIPAARKALVAALHATDESRLVNALRLSGQTQDPQIATAVRACLTHPSPQVRAAAVSAMDAMGLVDHGDQIRGFVAGSHEELRGAAVRYLLVRGARPREFARSILDGDDKALQRHVVDALFERPCSAREALTLAWVDARLTSPDSEDRYHAARALGALSGVTPVQPLRTLLADADPDVRRAALRSAIQRPSRELLDALLPMLLEPAFHDDARLAVARLGEAAVPALVVMLDDAAQPRVQSLAANTLAQIGGSRAVEALRRLARGSDRRLRHLGLRSLARVRVRTGREVLSREFAHRMFLRELREYRADSTSGDVLSTHATPEVRLLGESHRESADMALERAVQALACWYEPRPLIGALDRLRARDRQAASPALEFLERILPRAVFGPVRKVFEMPTVAAGERSAEADPLAAHIGAAWDSDDGWLRACAVRASRFSPSFDTARFDATDEREPLVLAELAALRRLTGRAPEPLAVVAAC